MSKTYRGKTGGGWVRRATVGKSKAGIGEVWIDGCVALTDGSSLVLHDASGLVAMLALSPRARRELRAKTAQAEAL